MNLESWALGERVFFFLDHVLYNQMSLPNGYTL